jgi:hypothetical protein
MIGGNMLDRQRVGEILKSLDWTHGLDREAILRQLLQRNVALPNEFLSAIEPTETFHSADQILQSVPDVVWTIHAEREERARGSLEHRGTPARAAQGTAQA